METPNFSTIRIVSCEDLYPALNKIREEDKRLIGYEKDVLMTFSCMSIRKGRIGYHTWICGAFDTTKSNRVGWKLSMPWDYAHLYVPRQKLDETRFGSVDQYPAHLNSFHRRDDGFQLSGLYTDKDGDVMWKLIRAELKGPGPVYKFTVTLWLPHTIASWPLDYPMSYRFERGMLEADIPKGSTKTKNQLAIKLLNEPSVHCTVVPLN